MNHQCQWDSIPTGTTDQVNSYLRQVNKLRQTNPLDLSQTPAKLLMQDSHTVTPTLLAVGTQPINLACRSHASDQRPRCLLRKRAKEDSVPFFYKKGTLTST